MTFRLACVGNRAALVDDADQFYDLERISAGSLPCDPMAAIACGPDALHKAGAAVESAEPDGAIAEATLGAPVPSPRNSFGIGLNYRSHAEESNMAIPTNPMVFTKFPSCIVGPHDDVVLDSPTADYEAELVVVIGTTARKVTAEQAWDHVLGVTVGQDISDRVLQFASQPPHFDLGKSRDTYGPMGPLLVSVDLLADRNDLRVTCDVNGERRQHDTTANMIFDVGHLVSYLSSVLTLSPGDVIFTGTPEGIGAASGKFLREGDEIVSHIDGIGTLRNRCVA